MELLVEKFKKFIEQQQLIESGDRIVVAVSGGLDSVVLLHLLLHIRHSMDLEIITAHLNHGIRGNESDEDAEFVESLSSRFHLKNISRKVDTIEFCAREKLSEEEGARVLRFRFFDDVLRQTDARSLALGHHANDQAETVLDHFLRGSGLKGLSGMGFKREKYIRPLLFATRKEIETYALGNTLDYKQDSTNTQLKYRRNKIRHRLIPDL